VTVKFYDDANGPRHFEDFVTQISFGDAEYRWHPDGANGFADPDGPATASMQSGGAAAQYLLPKASITVLRGTIQ
jgi:hypothetical protein